MSEIILMIEPSDVVDLTTLNGNTDNDSLKPMIFIAQTTYLKSFLGLNLYNKIYNDFVNDTLSGNYLTIFNEYIKDLLSYKTCELYVELGGFKIGQNGIHKITSENRETINETETAQLVLRFGKLVANVEGNFKEFVDPLQLPELQAKTITIDTNFPWQL